MKARQNKASREVHRQGSNNKENPNQNICAYAVACAGGVEDSVKYLHTIDDLKRAYQSRFSLASRLSMFGGRNASVAKAKAMMRELPNPLNSRGSECRGYLVWIEGHIILTDCNGNVIVDTDPRKSDRRKVQGIWAGYPKKNRGWL